MRKVLSIVLALAMVLGCFASVFAAEYTDVKADADYATAVDVLSDLGVVSGYTDGTYQPEKVVTRAEMAALIIKALGMTPAASATTNFSDVPATHWASGYVAYASSLGVIAGYTDGTFKPSKTVSYDEALTMIVSALGYTAEGLSGTWPTAYVMKAQELGITDDVDVLGSVGANRGDIAQMLYNTLGVKFVKYSKLTEEFAESTAAKNTMFKRLGATVDTTVTDVTPTVIKNAKVDLSDDLGAQIVAIRNTKGDIIAVDSYKTIFVEGKYTAGKTIGSYSIKGFDVSAVTNYVNGAVGASPAFTEAKKFAVDEENEKVVAAIQWKATAEFQVTADVKADAVKVGAYDLPTKDGKLDTTKFELVGAASVGEIKKNNIVTVYKEGNDPAGAVVKVEVGTETVIGKITKVVGTKATINGTAFTAPASPVFDKDYIVYLNYAGDEAVAPALYVEEAAEAETLYAVVLAAGYTETTDSFSDTVGTRQVKLVDATGAEVVLNVNKDANTGLLAKTDATFKSAPDLHKGDFVEYTLNDDGEIATMKAATFDYASTNVAVKNAMINKKAIASSVVVFASSKETVTDAKAKFTVASALADETYTFVKYMLNDKAQVAMIYVGPTTAAGEGDTFNAIYTGYAQVGKDSYELYFFDGAEKTVKATTAPGAITKDVFDTFVLKTDGTFSKVATADTFSAETITVTTGAAISGSTFIADENTAKSVVLAADVQFFMINEDGDWEVSDQDTMLAVVGDIQFIDNDKTADYIYDIVIFDEADVQ